MRLGRFVMLYANVVFGLNVAGPFDYSVGREFANKIKLGARVEVYLRNKKRIGYVIGLSKKTDIQNTRPILRLLDDFPVLDKKMLLLTKEISDYYCCFWGEAIELALPQNLRKGKSSFFSDDGIRYSKDNFPDSAQALPENKTFSVLLLEDIDGKARWEVYLKEIKEAVSNKKGVIILLQSKNCVLGAKRIIESQQDLSGFHLKGLTQCPLSSEGSCISILSKENPKTELEEWVRIKSANANIVLGSRSAVFAPVSNLGLIIMDEEEDPVYKQDQSPHYNAGQAALMRAKIEKARLILGSSSPSLENFYLAKKNKIRYEIIPKETNFPEIKLVDLKSEYYLKKKENAPISRYLIDSISSIFNQAAGERGKAAGKVLLFLNRRGFATYAFCHNCLKVVRCPRCSINLVYHFQENQLTCHYCNFKMSAVKICPNCNSGYIRFAGLGTEKIESELSRIFPFAKIKRIEKEECLDLKEADIFITTSSVIKHTSYPEIIQSAGALEGKEQEAFDLIGVLSIDNSLNRVDLRSAEKTFALLTGLLKLTDKKIIIQTSLSAHHCFQALVKNNLSMFYEEELRQRKQLCFPPYRHMVKVLLRARKEEKVKEAASFLFSKLKENNKDKGIHLLSAAPGNPLKLRGKFYWQILISSCNVKRMSEFLKLYLKKFSPSGIIVTVDVDPV
ncbi:MAG: primosomal protein N' [Candidatus Omnitrophota bacterium]|nr:primosomal protein N' [Candidatus Omnitrophota bacterium]